MLGRNQPNLGRIRANSTRAGPIWAALGPTSANCGQIWPRLDQSWAGFGQIGDGIAQIQVIAAEIKSSPGINPTGISLRQVGALIWTKAGATSRLKIFKIGFLVRIGVGTIFRPNPSPGRPMGRSWAWDAPGHTPADPRGLVARRAPTANHTSTSLGRARDRNGAHRRGSNSSAIHGPGQPLGVSSDEWPRNMLPRGGGGATRAATQTATQKLADNGLDKRSRRGNMSCRPETTPLGATELRGGATSGGVDLDDTSLETARIRWRREGLVRLSRAS